MIGSLLYTKKALYLSEERIYVIISEVQKTEVGWSLDEYKTEYYVVYSFTKCTICKIEKKYLETYYKIIV